MELTPNTEVSPVETGAFSVGDMIYKNILRNLLVAAVDNPNHIYDDRALASADGAFAYKGE